MSDLPPRPLPDDGNEDVLAAEYVLGVLDADARRRAEQLLREHPGFARAVAAWEERLGPLADAVEPVRPSEHVWARIEAQTRPRDAARTTRQEAGSDFWRWLSYGSMALAAASLAAAIFFAYPRGPTPVQVAALSSQDGRAHFTAVIDVAGSEATLVPLSAWTAPGRVPELWLVPAGGAPVSLGVFDPSQTRRIAVPRAVIEAIGAGMTLAVSVEPPGGSPTGQPTGPVIATGTVQAL